MIWWVRHGPTHQKTFTGWRDVPADLSDTEALRRLAEFLPNAPIVSSDLMRTRDTADAIARGRARLPDHPGLREIDFGAWDGLHWEEIDRKWPDLSREFWEKPGDVRAPDGESWNLASERVEAARREIQKDRPGDLIIVAHFGAILTQVQRAANCSAYDVLAQKIDNLSVTCIPEAGPPTLINHLA